MPLISWFLRSIHHRATRCRVVRTVITGAATVCIVLLLMTGYSRSEMGGVSQGTMVAAGFGSQIAGVSAITVKTYNAVSGEVLSNDTFELNVKDEGDRFHSVQDQDRIFAGGTGVGATDLSNFILRVYDANTGAFQWEGRLNLSPQEGSGVGLPVSTLVPRRATVTRIHAVDNPLPQSFFLVRALDTTTGGLVWKDEFSTSGAGAVERIAQRLKTQTGGAVEGAHTFDLTIRMCNAEGQGILWEDQFEQESLEEEAHETVDDQAHILPAWPRLDDEERIPRDI